MLIGDFLIRIKNGYLARHKTVETPYGKVLWEIGKILKKRGFIEEVKVSTPVKKTIIITLAYPRRKAALTNLKLVSKPGLRVYVGKNRIPRVFGGFGIVIVSTSKGIMTKEEAIKNNLGGEVLCKVW
ncbi:30S ribosomal protein S8 [Candidatus Microgenomates bacterium]|nr:30S ribosomal protein S8 [Candidatus Microgenomates bacterium]